MMLLMIIGEDIMVGVTTRTVGFDGVVPTPSVGMLLLLLLMMGWSGSVVLGLNSTFTGISLLLLLLSCKDGTMGDLVLLLFGIVRVKVVGRLVFLLLCSVGFILLLLLVVGCGTNRLGLLVVMVVDSWGATTTCCGGGSVMVVVVVIGIILFVVL
jgi:hypothetical protein